MRAIYKVCLRGALMAPSDDELIERCQPGHSWPWKETDRMMAAVTTLLLRNKIRDSSF